MILEKSYIEAVMVAVSYTHLDVYKRQAGKRAVEKEVRAV